MKRWAMLGVAFGLLVVLNGLVLQKERLIAEGNTVLLPLAPVDPRSIMQGDYMRLRYQLERDISKALAGRVPHTTRAVVSIDQKGVGTFARLLDDSPVGPDERIVNFSRTGWTGVVVAPRSYFFQEGHAKFYEPARFGVFKFGDKGARILVGLARADQTVIEPPQLD